MAPELTKTGGQLCSHPNAVRRRLRSAAVSQFRSRFPSVPLRRMAGEAIKQAITEQVGMNLAAPRCLCR